MITVIYMEEALKNPKIYHVILEQPLKITQDSVTSDFHFCFDSISPEAYFTFILPGQGNIWKIIFSLDVFHF